MVLQARQIRAVASEHDYAARATARGEPAAAGSASRSSSMSFGCAICSRSAPTSDQASVAAAPAAHSGAWPSALSRGGFGTCWARTATFRCGSLPSMAAASIGPHQALRQRSVQRRVRGGVHCRCGACAVRRDGLRSAPAQAARGLGRPASAAVLASLLACEAEAIVFDAFACPGGIRYGVQHLWGRQSLWRSYCGPQAPCFWG